ncbi:MAG: hypothetical protein FJ386_13230 [Verrucomicrobia bacterium]|nr:hypothetical protein [Verrucomicrobiota bacterium]
MQRFTCASRRVAQSGAVFVRLQSRRATAELRALAPDLFRLRLTRGRDFAARPSMAIEKVSWPSTDSWFDADS